jgi:hypothetical protein
MEKYSIQKRQDRTHTKVRKFTKENIEGDVEGHIARGRPRAEYMTQLMQDTNKGNYKDLKELSYDRESRRAATNKSTDL